ncbi:ABC transporter substrate-binding protein [Pseudonocardia sp. N23]|uniref:ABC transporter substrate-binding protein n=1 Tax=Pseudonocardia sp. N23 TaxID=1987376 RepID=UPI000BFC3D1B|nr:ABC transporter substrate-binding protein [Pseudonocardia sp. N23]GAY10436.1 dipeptide-binding ABC transporter, periplasmic substrate-binding component [Pseudonocardia sp. N23]
MRLDPERTRPHARRVAIVAAAIGLALVAAACGSSGGGGGAGAAATLDTSHPHGGDPAQEGTPVAGGTLVVGSYTEARSYDPTVGSNLVASAIYDSLMKMDASGTPQPFLARSMDTPDQGRTWVLTLRPNVRFHDGTPLDADAVIFNVKRQQDKPTALGHLYTTPIASMTAVDPLTVRFDLNRPVGSFPVVFALPFGSGNLGTIASPTAVVKYGADYGRNPVGAGPFRFVEWIPNNKATVVRNDDYWQPGLPHLDGIEFRPLSDTETRYASLVNGDIDLDIAGFHSEVFRASQNKDLRVYFGPGGDGEYLYFNVTRKPFDDPRMREAIIHAIDPTALSATQYQNTMAQAVTAFAAGDQYYSEKAAQEWPAYDPERARQLIADYRASGGDPDFTFSDSNSPGNIQFATFLQAQWMAVGLDVTLKFDDLATLVTTVVQGGQFQMVHWIAGPYENPYPFMFNQFHSGGINNYGRYANPQVDAALDEAAATTDQATRVAAYQRVQELVNADRAVVWLSRAYKAALTNQQVRGVQRYLSSEIFWGSVWMAT